MTTAHQSDSPKARIDAGLKHLWYPVLASWQLGSTPRGITRLGTSLVLWRNSEGQIHAVEDRCPHRGARLSLGCASHDRIACWYHGVEVDAQGVVANVPAADHANMRGRKALISFPVEERQGAIFVWFGGGDAPPLRLPHEPTSQEFSGFLCTAVWRCNYRYAHDNLMDLMHGAYLHAVSHSMSGGEKRASMEVVDTPDGFIFRKTDQAELNFDWVEFMDLDAHWMRATVPYGPGAGPGGPFWIIGGVVPIDNNTCQVFFWRLRKVSGWQRAAWRFLYRTKLEARHWAVLEQDREVLEGLIPDARDHESLYSHDAGLVRLRRLLSRAAESELRLEAQAEHHAVSWSETRA
ncbi:aromatic ring-hydroxylating dioxygenase subunit alpha [Roseiarcaceae bacterium H3SJ34-1]|uniref:Rieske 2Fe-2S domain-containing protein n=1 Tax=Terripilifer ovatus TaxID=3032367 RepID=UPI003AB9AB2D|nr:aromatic ring-hydroxylating dioxygenase subunit alpha [Roseiarcaceae bacterium H3SJ34-1]